MYLPSMTIIKYVQQKSTKYDSYCLKRSCHGCPGKNKRRRVVDEARVHLYVRMFVGWSWWLLLASLFPISLISYLFLPPLLSCLPISAVLSQVQRVRGATPKTWTGRVRGREGKKVKGNTELRACRALVFYLSYSSYSVLNIPRHTFCPLFVLLFGLFLLFFFAHNHCLSYSTLDHSDADPG